MKRRMNSTPPYHVIATDMDGTLLVPNHVVSAFTKKVLQQIVAHYPHEVFVILASGRPVVDLACTLEGLELPEYCGYIISLNGARVHRIVTTCNPVDGSVKERQMEQVVGMSLSAEDVRRLLLLLPEGETEVNINMFQRDEWHCTLDWTDELNYYASGFRYDLFQVQDVLQAYHAYRSADTEAPTQRPSACANDAVPLDDPDPLNPLGGVGKVFFGSDNLERLHQLCNRIKEELPHLTLTFSSPYCMELTAPGVTKASGLAHLLPLLQAHTQKYRIVGCTEKDKLLHHTEEPWDIAKDCIAFGDSENDEVLLRSVAKGCMMANSSRKLLEKLPLLEVIKSNAEDGVAAKLMEVYSL